MHLSCSCLNDFIFIFNLTTAIWDRFKSQFFKAICAKGNYWVFFPYHFAFIRTWILSLIQVLDLKRNLKMHIFNYIKLAIYITKRGDRFETFNFALIRLNYIYSKHILQVKILHCHCIYNGSVLTFIILKISVTIRISILCEEYSKCCFINMTVYCVDSLVKSVHHFFTNLWQNFYWMDIKHINTYVTHLCKTLSNWVFSFINVLWLTELKIIFNNLKSMIYETVVNDTYNEAKGV